MPTKIVIAKRKKQFHVRESDSSHRITCSNMLGYVLLGLVLVSSVSAQGLCVKYMWCGYAAGYVCGVL